MPTYQAGTLQAKAYRVLRGHLSASLTTYGVTMQEWAILGHVATHPDCRHADIATLLGVESPLATNLINQLQAKKLVRRLPDPADARAKLLECTAAGTKLVDTAEQELRQDLGKFLSDIPRGDLQIYIKVLQKISDKGR